MVHSRGVDIAPRAPISYIMSIASTRSARLPHLGILRFSGADALSFLQGQISNDTQRLTENFPVFAAYSSPQGRVLALIYLLPHTSGVAAILPREILQPTLERMRKYILRAKVRIEDAGESLIVAGRVGSLPESSSRYMERDGIGTAPVGRDTNRSWIIGAPDKMDGALSAVVDAESARSFEQAWRLADIHAGLPQVYAATSEAFIAQMLNLDLLDGISFSKGCYTGQEIIARTQHLGRIKRRLYRLLLPAGEWSIGQALNLSDGRQGRVTEVIDSNGRVEALAVLNVEPNPPAAGEAARNDLVEAAELPLPYPF
jgi:folate-binding protein YgfZ